MKLKKIISTVTAVLITTNSIFVFADTGPILGLIQEILFDPIAFSTIPVGCMIGGVLHDYMSGMISIRNDGTKMPSLIHMYLGKYTYVVYNVCIGILILLVGAVFIYPPGDLFVTQILKSGSSLKRKHIQMRNFLII